MELFSFIDGFWNKNTLAGATAIFVLVIIYRLLSKTLLKHFEEKGVKQDERKNFFLFWRYGWYTLGIVLLLVSFSGSIAGLGISAAFLGLIMGWSLQAPVTGLAGWLMIILKRPFKIGDRIIIAGITGDVTDINLTHIVLNQVGGTIGGEERSGRAVLIPNATLFGQIIYNYTSESHYLLDEVVINVTFESDMEEANKILLLSAEEVTGDVMRKTNEKPFIRTEIMEYGVRLRLRYKAFAKDRQRTTSEISVRILKGFRASDKVAFAYPHTEIVYKPDTNTRIDANGTNSIKS